MVFEQMINITGKDTSMRRKYDESTCYAPSKAVDGITAGYNANCSCAQNGIYEWPQRKPQWWGVTLSKEEPIVAVTVYLKQDEATAAACEDKLKEVCLGWSKIGMCIDKFEFMKVNCTKSCGFCDAPLSMGASCTDTNETYCQWMATNDECVRNPPYMLSKCSKSCNVCTETFKAEFDQSHSSAFKKINVYVGNSSSTTAFPSDTEDITTYFQSGFTYFGTYEGPPTTNSVVIRRATDTSVTGKFLYLTKNDTDGILAICEVKVWIHNPNNGSRMCLDNSTQEQKLKFTSAMMDREYPAGNCRDPSKTIDGTTTDTGCDCAQNAVMDYGDAAHNYWWAGKLANNSIIRALHVWVRQQEASSCVDTDQACPGWAIVGMCLNSSDTMFTKCPLSCGLCNTAPVSTSSAACSDVNSTCPTWSSASECTKNPPLMWKYCRDTCEFCPGKVNYTAFLNRVNATFKDITVWVGQEITDKTLLSGDLTSKLQNFTSLRARVSTTNPTVIRISFEKEIQGDFIVIQKPSLSGPLAICEVEVLGMPSKFYTKG